MLVNKKPQYLVFCYQSEHLDAKQRRLPVESRKRPCGARIPAGRSASNPVQARVCRPKPATKISLVLAGAGGKTQKRCRLGDDCGSCGDYGNFRVGGDRGTRVASFSQGSPATGLGRWGGGKSRLPGSRKWLTRRCRSFCAARSVRSRFPDSASCRCGRRAGKPRRPGRPRRSRPMR